MPSVEQLTRRSRVAIWSLAVAGIITVATLILLLISGYRQLLASAGVRELHVKITELRYLIVDLDEALTMSARMAADTGDRQWEERYRSIEPKLDAAIKELTRIAPGVYTEQAVLETDLANAKLVDMENRAFALVLLNRSKEAQLVLSSEEYKEQKLIYSGGMERLGAQLEGMGNANRKSIHTNEVRKFTAAFVIVTLLTGCWAFVLRTMDQSQSTLIAASAQLSRQAEELTGLNAGLDLKVAERTLELAIATGKLQAVMDATTQVSMIATDTSGLITVFNSGAERMLGYSTEEIVGKQSPVVFHLESEVSARGREMTEQSGRLIEGFDIFIESARQGKHEEREWTYVRKDGTHLTVTLVATALLNETGVFIGCLGVAKDITARKHAEDVAKRANAKLTVLVGELEARKREMTLLREMGELLQTCGTLQEASSVIAQSLRQLFPTESGALYLLMASRNLVERSSVWGETPPEAHLFPPGECWALRRGQVHIVEDWNTGRVCQHVKQTRSGGYLCIPMQAQNDVLGVLQLTLSKSDGPEGIIGDEDLLNTAKPTLAVAAAEQIALALSNIRLRESLGSQAIRDPLTGLFNRRYLEETLAQEFCRAERSHQPIGVIMIDIDHFKRYNDIHGHDAGDVVLSTLGQFLKEKIRGGDTACRYGGEEFTIILPGSSMKDTLKKAEFLCDEVKQMKVNYRGQPLESVTLSLGVAGFPGNGSSGEALLRAADQALYQAKAAGRDRVVSAGLHAGSASGEGTRLT